MTNVKIKGVPRRRAPVRTVLAVVVVVAVLVVAWSQRSVIWQVLLALSQGAPFALAAAAVFEGGRIALHGYAYTRSFAVIGTRVPLASTVAAWFKAVFMNTVLPSGGTSGMAAVIDTGRRRGASTGSATSATLFTQTCYYLAMFVVVLVGFAVMGRAGSLQPSTVAIGMIMGVVSAVFLGLLAMGHYAPRVLQKALRALERLVGRACARIVFLRAPNPWADSLVHSFSSAATELSRRPRKALAVFGVMVGAMACDTLAFVACGFAFAVERPDVLLAGYVTAIVFNSFNVTPGGVGVVEGLAAAVLAGYGYPVAQCVSAVLAYRAFVYWIPFVVGGILMRVTGAFGMGREKAAKTVAEAPAEAAARVAERVVGADEPAYVSRRRSELPLRKRVATYVHGHMELRTALCAMVLAATSVAGFVVASLPADAGLLEAVTDAALWRAALNPAAATVCAYLVMLTVPGVLVRDQGSWFLAIALLIALGLSTALSGRGVAASVCAIAALVVLAFCHDCFARTGFLKSMRRLLVILVFALAAAVLYAVVGGVVLSACMTSHPSAPAVVWVALQSLVAMPPFDEALASGQALWFFVSVRAVGWAFAATSVLLTALAVVRRVLDRRRRA